MQSVEYDYDVETGWPTDPSHDWHLTIAHTPEDAAALAVRVFAGAMDDLDRQRIVDALEDVQSDLPTPRGWGWRGGPVHPHDFLRLLRCLPPAALADAAAGIRERHAALLHHGLTGRWDE